MSPGRRRLVIYANASLTVMSAGMIAAGVTILLSRPAPPETVRVLARDETMVTEPARLRRGRVRYRVKRPRLEPFKVATEQRAEAAKVVRVIPIRRWPIWCERVGGLEC